MGQVVLTSLDAFTFDSVNSSREGDSTLEELLRTYDYLDRGIPNAADFAASVNRLGRAGMITFSSGRFRTSRFGTRMAKRYRQRARGPIESSYRLGKAWEGITVEEMVPEFAFAIGDADYRRAFALPPVD